MAPRLDIEQIVARQRQGQLRFVRQRMPVERRVDESVAGRRRLVRRGAVLRRNVLDLDPAVDLATGAGQARENPQRRDLRRRPVILDRRPNCVGGQFAAPGDAARLCRTWRRARPRNRNSRPCPGESVYSGRPSRIIAGRRLVDEIAVAAVIDAALDVDRPCGVVQAQLAAIASLDAERRVADQKLLRCRRARRWRTALGSRASAPRATATGPTCQPGMTS